MLQRYFMDSQLRNVGDRLKASVKVEGTETADNATGVAEALGWSEEVEGDGAIGVEEMEEGVEEDADEEEDEMEVVEEEEEEADRDHWTSEDWRKVKAAGSAAEVIDVEDPNKKWRVKAPWAGKTNNKKSAHIVRNDKWGGTCWSDGWYQDSRKKWWPFLR